MIKAMKRKYLKNTKGMSTVEFVISFFVFILLFSFIFDLFFIAYRQYAISNEANKLIRVISMQNGALPTVPDNYPGGADNYLTTNEIYQRLDDKFKILGATDYSVKIKAEDESLPSGERVIVLPNATGIKTDYRNYIKIEIDYEYKWGLWSQLINKDLKGNMSVSRTGFAEYKFDYDDWEGER